MPPIAKSVATRPRTAPDTAKTPVATARIAATPAARAMVAATLERGRRCWETVRDAGVDVTDPFVSDVDRVGLSTDMALLQPRGSGILTLSYPWRLMPNASHCVVVCAG